MSEYKVEEVVANMKRICNEQKKKLGLTNKQIAEKAGKTESYVGRFLNGKVKDPYISDMMALGDALGFKFKLGIE